MGLMTYIKLLLLSCIPHNMTHCQSLTLKMCIRIQVTVIILLLHSKTHVAWHESSRARVSRPREGTGLGERSTHEPLTVGLR